jgi:hypothetical protein
VKWIAKAAANGLALINKRENPKNLPKGKALDFFLSKVEKIRMIRL